MIGLSPLFLHWYYSTNFVLGKDEKSDSDIDDGATEFEVRAKRMLNVLEDGGVKKKVNVLT